MVLPSTAARQGRRGGSILFLPQNVISSIVERQVGSDSYYICPPPYRVPGIVVPRNTVNRTEYTVVGRRGEESLLCDPRSELRV